MTKKENETSLKKAIKMLFKTFSITYYSNPQGLGAVRGRPDIEAIYKGITYYIECKHPKEGGRMSQYQRAQRDKIELSGAPYVKAQSVEDVIKALGLTVKGLF
jgi:hypothetical protein